MTLYIKNRDPSFWNTPRENCNCGSYALDTCSWVVPYSEGESLINGVYNVAARSKIFKDGIKNGIARQKILKDVLNKDVEYLLQVIPWIELTTPEALDNKSRLIAYRLAWRGDEFSPDDFHFRVRINGQWYEKHGWSMIQKCPAAEVGSPWGGIYDDYYYDSKIIFFRFKKN